MTVVFLCPSLNTLAREGGAERELGEEAALAEQYWVWS